MKNKGTHFLVQGAAIAAVYVVLTLVFAPLSFGEVQIRFSEALTVLPFFTPAAIPGLFVGCIIANLLGGAIPVDIIFGSIATLIGAFFTYKLRNTSRWTAPIPPIVSNIVIVPLVLRYGYGINLPIPFMMLTVGAGEFISAGVIGMILLGALLVKAVTGMKYRKSFFIIELPEYKVPSLKIGVLSMLNRGKAYIKKAGTVILVCNTVVQIMQSFNWKLQVVAEGAESTSILASIAGPFATLLIPVVGIAAWQLAAASITGFIAKENVVGTLATVYALTNFIDTDELALVGSGNEVAAVMQITKVAALAYLMFNLYTPPCFAALGAMNSEMQSGKWLFAGICLQLATGFTVGFLVYQIGTLITTGALGAGFVGGLIAVLIFAAIIVYLIQKANRVIDTEYQLD